jgi:phytoene/squalene synthetase
MGVDPVSVDDLAFTDELDFGKVLKNPILDIAARLWEDDRYEAFKTCYRSMRAIDDLVDGVKSQGGKISEAERGHLASRVNGWVQAIEDGQHNDAYQKRLAETMERFRIPLWPWRKLAESMIYDLYHNGFSTFQDFLTYSEGAAVAPGSVFTFLCGIRKADGEYHPPPFDAREASRPTALYCYLVHIIRDFQKDQNENLNYFSDDLMAEHGLDTSNLREVAAGGEVSAGLRSLMGRYVKLAEGYGRESRDALEKIGPHLESRYLLSLRVLHSLYDQILERVDVRHGSFTAAELNPSPEEIDERIRDTISSFKSGR